ncbi:hypothetical protein B0J12DRAFT_327391 [Macrophomina phaseolina]|uniref:Secreted protein n=1 Tax=Macrophomina phaseolina TaxID=35725 RepID=A0ABQ8FW66_9PEZI|nr:hypothetical protein B0J12DRAFT_327391 [Macrophomina phaseolina]
MLLPRLAAALLPLGLSRLLQDCVRINTCFHPHKVLHSCQGLGSPSLIVRLGHGRTHLAAISTSQVSSRYDVGAVSHTDSSRSKSLRASHQLFLHSRSLFLASAKSLSIDYRYQFSLAPPVNFYLVRLTRQPQ